MKIGEKILEKVFVGETTADAYKKAMRYIARNVVNKGYVNISTEIHKEEVNGQKAIRVVFITLLDYNRDVNDYCKVCKEVHSLFFVNESYNCSRCNLKNFAGREKTKVNTSKLFYKHELED